VVAPIASKECLDMAIILSFVPPKRLPSRVRKAGSASIIIFPGVRYENAGGSGPADPKSARRGQRPKGPERPSPARL
jgi:hypothetical protein